MKYIMSHYRGKLSLFEMYYQLSSYYADVMSAADQFLSASALFMYPKMLINSNIIYILYWKLSSCRSHGLLVYTLRFSASTNPPCNVICSCSPSLTPYHFLPSPYSSLNMEWHTARNKEKSHKYRSVKEYLTL